MIKLFRTIRQKLLTENRVNKYFLYAIGEIVLVVIGILIALQINTWNEVKKELREEQKLLANLNDEFRENAETLDTTIKRSEDTNKKLNILLGLFGPKTKHDNNGDRLDKAIASCLNNAYWDRTEFVLKDLENSGRLSKLSNQKLKNDLYKWSKLNSSIADKDEDANISYLYFLNYLKDNAALRQIDFQSGFVSKSNLIVDHSFLLSDIKFESAVNDYYIYNQQRIERFKKAKTIIQEIIDDSKPRIKTEK